MRLRSPEVVDAAIQTLRQLNLECGSCRSATNVEDAKTQYLSWVDMAYDQFHSLFVDGLLADGLHSQLYWEIYRLNSSSPRPWDLLRREVQIQGDRIGDAITTLTGFKEFTDRDGRIVVLDTSGLVRGEWFEDVDWPAQLDLGPQIRIVIPILVIEELDRLKDRERTTKVGERARKVIKCLRDLHAGVQPGLPASIPKRNNVTIEVLLDSDWHQRRPNNDGEIIDQALHIQEMTGQEVWLACVDAALESMPLSLESLRELFPQVRTSLESPILAALALEFRARQHGLLVFAMPTSDEVRSRDNH